MNNLNRLVLRDMPAPKAVEIDQEARAIYVRFRSGKVKKTLSDNKPGAICTIDLNANNQVIGVELVGVRGFSLKAIRSALPDRLRDIDFERAEFRPAVPSLTPA